MTIRGTNTITVADVLVGDVWMGSGQSNMQWAVRQSDNADAETAAAKFPQIRFFYVPRKTSAMPVEDVDAKWVDLHARDGQGVLGGPLLFRPADAPGSEGADGTDSLVVGWHADRLVDQRAVTRRQRPARAAAHFLGERHPPVSGNHEPLPAGAEDAGRPADRRARDPRRRWAPGNAHEPTSLYNGMIAPLAKYTIKGALWYQGETEAGRAQGHVYGDALMTLVQDWRRRSVRAISRSTGCSSPTTATRRRTGTGCGCRKGRSRPPPFATPGSSSSTTSAIRRTFIRPTSRMSAGGLRYSRRIEGASPLYRQFTREGAAMRIWFDHAAMSCGARRRAAEGIPDRRRGRQVRAATAVIEGSTVVVSSPEVTNPLSARYAGTTTRTRI